MKWGWVLITLYMGPVGAALYVFTDKEPAPGSHEEFIRPLWKQGVGSTVHCVAGDATGIIVAAAVTAALGYAMWIDFIAEYVAGFAFGLSRRSPAVVSRAQPPLPWCMLSAEEPAPPSCLRISRISRC